MGTSHDMTKNRIVKANNKSKLRLSRNSKSGMVVVNQCLNVGKSKKLHITRSKMICTFEATLSLSIEGMP
jgi:hypothetical protein